MKKKITTLSELFLNPIEKSLKQKENTYPLTLRHIYTTDYISDSVHALWYKKKWRA